MTSIALLTKQRDILLECIKAACRCIALDRQCLADCHTDPKSGQLDDAGKAGVAGFDALLSKIDEAIAIASQPPPIRCAPRGSRPFFSLHTAVGDGAMAVECRFNVDDEDRVCDLEVWTAHEDIFRALAEKQIEDLDVECFASAEASYKESKTDAAIDRHLESLEP